MEHPKQDSQPVKCEGIPDTTPTPLEGSASLAVVVPQGQLTPRTVRALHPASCWVLSKGCVTSSKHLLFLPLRKAHTFAENYIYFYLLFIPLTHEIAPFKMPVQNVK